MLTLTPKYISFQKYQDTALTKLYLLQALLVASSRLQNLNQITEPLIEMVESHVLRGIHERFCHLLTFFFYLDTGRLYYMQITCSTDSKDFV